MRTVSLAATLMLAHLLLVPSAASAADDLERSNEDGVEQVIPPAVIDDMGHDKSQPLDFAEIVITDKTPADDFVSATTPLVVALMLGSVGLVIYTLARGDKYL